jgi:hypothetical protein
MVSRLPFAALSAAGLQRGRSAHIPSRSVRRGVDPLRNQPLTRRYDVLSLAPNGDINEFSRVAPATPVFEDAFAALARGTLIATEHGPVAVEDLVPGTRIDTLTAGLQPLLWIGAMTVYPDGRQGPGGEGAGLTRLAADTFGFGRPAPDLVLGPRARILFRSSQCQGLVGAEHAFAPARAFTDGDGVIEVMPVSPVRVFHLALHGQQVIRANGMEVESFHPGSEPEAVMTPETMELFLSLFPHIERPRDFGPIEIPRLTAFELERLRAA